MTASVAGGAPGAAQVRRASTGQAAGSRPAAAHLTGTAQLASLVRLSSPARPAVQARLLVAGISPAAHGAGGSRKAPKPRTPREVARKMLRQFHWRAGQFTDLNRLWNAESGWNVHASNPFSGAYGIPQAMPGAKMASAGPSWRSNAATQIRWGLRYIRSVYGSPHRAWRHEVSTGWY